MSFTHTTVALAWLLVALNFVGLGALLLRAGVPGSPPSLRAAFWVGWAGWIGALECIHFFVPLGSAGVSLPLVLAGAFGLVWNAGPWWQAIRDSLREHPRAWGACLLFALWLANRSLGPLMTIDAGLYHLGSIQWASEHPLVGGLANLHGRLAFNSTAFLWMASLDPLFESLRGFHFAASLLVLVAVVERVTRALGTRDVVRRRFELCMLLPLGYAATVIHLSSTNPDWIVLVLGTVAASALLDLLSPGDAHERDETLVALAALAAVGVTVKLSFAVLAGAIGFTVITRLARSTPRPTHRARVVATMLVVWLAVPWLLRGVELSGYPAYPLSLLAPGVAWQVPEERARGEVDWVRSWARDPERTPEEVLADSSWLGPWLRARVRQSDSIALLLFPATLALASLGLSLGLSLRRNRVDANPPHSPAPHPPDPRSLVLVPYGVAVGAWFASAPDPRFLGAALWVPAAWWAARALSVLATQRTRALASTLFVSGFLFYCTWITHQLDAWWFDAGRPPEPPRIETRTVTTRTGLALHVPKQGQLCWEAPLPCTPYPAPRLGLRDPDDPWSGYQLVGDSPAPE